MGRGGYIESDPLLEYFLDDKPVIDIEGDAKGEIIAEEGKDVSLKCRLEGELFNPFFNRFPFRISFNNCSYV